MRFNVKRRMCFIILRKIVPNKDENSFVRRMQGHTRKKHPTAITNKFQS